MENNNINQLTLIDTPKAVSKASIEAFANNVLQELESGWASPIDILVNLKSIEKASDIIKEAIMKEAVTEYERNKEGRGEMKFGNFIIALMTAGAKYDFTNDPIWQSLKEELDEAKEVYITPIEAQLQEREVVLKRHADRSEVEPVVEVNPYTGEEFTRQSPKQTGGKQILKFTLK
jgi:hypothetical protein